MSSKQRRTVEPLATRNVFLDTQVYRALGHNPDNPALTALKEHINAHRVVLHTTDITLLEIMRQLRESVAARARELREIEKDLRRWRHQAPKSMPKTTIEFDPEKVAGDLFSRLRSFLLVECGARVHQALKVDPEPIFARYFERRPPFDKPDAKEFPDAFMIEVLARWAKNEQESLYIVTEDRAMIRAADGDANLLPLHSIHDVLTRAAAPLGAEAESEAEALLNKPAFDTTLAQMLEAQMKEATFVYTGDLAEAEAYEGELVAIEEVGDWSVIGITKKRLTVLLDVRAKVKVEVQYEDRDSATYDREDDRWVGTENASTDVEEIVDIKVLAEIARSSGKVAGGKILTDEIDISGPSDFDY